MVRFNGLPSGHTDLHRRHPGLEKNFLEGVMVAEMFPASFRPEVVEDESAKNVERLSGVSKSASVVREEAGGVRPRVPWWPRQGAQNARRSWDRGEFSICSRCAWKPSTHFEPLGNQVSSAEGFPRHRSCTSCSGGECPWFAAGIRPGDPGWGWARWECPLFLGGSCAKFWRWLLSGGVP